jgi:hypothetical protein
VEAPSEAEAQCAEMCKGGKVWATASEDMDSLTFATPILLRHLLYAEARKVAPVVRSRIVVCVCVCVFDLERRCRLWSGTMRACWRKCSCGPSRCGCGFTVGGRGGSNGQSHPRP